MTAVLDTNPEAPTQTVEPDVRLASWPVRAGAFAVDILPGLSVAAATAPWTLTGPRLGWLWWVFTAVAALSLLAVLANRILLPVLTGWTLGRALFGIRVQRRDGAAPGPWRLLLRDLAHLLDTGSLLIGWFWPVWDPGRRTFADLLLRTEVRRVEQTPPGIRRTTGTVLVAGALVCVMAASLSYLVVYRPERTVDTARQQIAEQGPRIVEQLLTYHLDTIDEDFARAQSLATDVYRDQVIAQQESVRQGEPTTNEYWAVSSAVLSVEKDEAAMLLAMQGQRGTDPKDLKLITATLRVDFRKSDDGQWRVANLTVLKKPLMDQAGQ